MIHLLVLLIPEAYNTIFGATENDMWTKNKLVERLKITYPIIQGPMSGASPPSLVSAVSNAGGLGCLGAAQMTPEQIRKAIIETRRQTEKPFAVNLFVPEEITMPSNELIGRANKALDPFRRKLGIAESPEFKPVQLSFMQQLAVVLEEKVPIFSFTFGILSADIIQKLQSHHITVMGTATTCRQAILLEQSGVDFIIAQGSEAGGHRGSAPETQIDSSLIGGMALIPQIIDQVKVPVIAAGGIMDGRGIVAALALGASAVQMGTAFMTCTESGINAKHREALLKSCDESTCITRAFTGRYARTIKNQIIMTMAEQQNDILPYPLQRALTRDIAVAAAQQGKSEFMMMLSGQAAKLCRSVSVKTFFSELITEVDEVIQKFRT